MLRLKKTRNLDPKLETLIDNAYYVCKPPGGPHILTCLLLSLDHLVRPSGNDHQVPLRARAVAETVDLRRTKREELQAGYAETMQALLGARRGSPYFRIDHLMSAEPVAQSHAACLQWPLQRP